MFFWKYFVRILYGRGESLLGSVIYFCYLWRLLDGDGFCFFGYVSFCLDCWIWGGCKILFRLLERFVNVWFLVEWGRVGFWFFCILIDVFVLDSVFVNMIYGVMKIEISGIEFDEIKELEYNKEKFWLGLR